MVPQPRRGDRAGFSVNTHLGGSRMSTRRRLAVSVVAAAAVAASVPLFVGSGTAGAAPAPAGCPTLPSFFNTIPTPVGPPTAVSFNTDTSLIGYSALGADRKLYFYQQDASTTDDTTVSPLFCFGGQATDAPGVVTNGDDGSLAVFVRAANGTLYQRYVTTDVSSIGAFTPVNGAATTNGPAALFFGGTYHLFVRGTNGALYHGFRQTTSASSWRFEKIGGAIVGSPSATVDGNRVLVAVTGTNGSVYTVRGTNFAWGSFTRLPNQVAGNNPTQIFTNTPPSLVTRPNGRVSLFVANRTVGLFEITKPAGTNFESRQWERIDSLLPADARIAAAVDDGNDTIVYARFLDRSSGQTLTTYTQHFAGTGENAWTDYVLAPYTCFNCAPFDVSTGGPLAGKAGKSAGVKTITPEKVKLVPMPDTKKVLG
jgi:Repeat of unknown function (DUF346)